MEEDHTVIALPEIGQSATVNATELHEDDEPNFVMVTGYRLTTTCVALAFVIPKAVLTLNGETVVPTILDLVLGMCSIGLYWLGFMESVKPRRWIWFFHTDYSGHIKYGVRTLLMGYIRAIMLVWPVTLGIFLAVVASCLDLGGKARRELSRIVFCFLTASIPVSIGWFYFLTSRPNAPWIREQDLWGVVVMFAMLSSALYLIQKQETELL